MSKTYWSFSTILWAVLIFRLTTMPQVATVPNTLLQEIMMSGAHFIFFGLQAVFLYITLKPLKNAQIYAITGSIIYGLTIELIQRGIPGRTADPVDWTLDILGAFLFIFMVRKYE